MLGWSFILSLAACKVTSDDLEAVATLPVTQLQAPPPSAEGPGQKRLFQLLYAGESSDAAWNMGQRVRVRAWLASIRLRPTELEGFKQVVTEVHAAFAAGAAAEKLVEEAELATLAPVYAELEARLVAGGEVTDEDLAAVAEKLSSARVIAYGTTTPDVARQARVRALLDVVARWTGQLPETTHIKLSQARFFLVRRASPLGNPGAYHALVGLDWDGGEFSHLDETEAAVDQPQMDIGGLWALEKLRALPGRYLGASQVLTIVVLAALEPALKEALGITPQ